MQNKNEIVKISVDSFLDTYNPAQMIRTHSMVKTMKQAIEADTKSISVYSKEIGQAAVVGIIEMHLMSLCQSLNVHEKLSTDQMTEIAFEIVSMYYYLSVVEISHVFRKAKRGEYGKINYSINMPDVMTWFSTYAEIRCEYFMNKSDSDTGTNIQNANDSSIFNEDQMKALNSVKVEMLKSSKFNEEEYQEFKKKYQKSDIIK